VRQALRGISHSPDSAIPSQSSLVDLLRDSRTSVAVGMARQGQRDAHRVALDAAGGTGGVPDAGPGIEPRAERPESPVIRGARKPGEAECRPQELAPLVEHALTE
jgi:hypothetical protein